MTDTTLILTPAEAESLLNEGEYVHNFDNSVGGLMVGCDYQRADAIKAFNDAVQIEIGGDGCKAMKHPLAVWSSETRVTFFEADMDKVEAFEVSHGAA